MLEEGREELRLIEVGQARHRRRRELGLLRQISHTRFSGFVVALASFPISLLLLMLLLPLLLLLLRRVNLRQRGASRPPELPLGAVGARYTHSLAPRARELPRASAFFSPAGVAAGAEEGQRRSLRHHGIAERFLGGPGKAAARSTGHGRG